MTFQEAQVKFTAIVQSINTNLSSAQLNAKQVELQTLLNSLPNTAEFDPIADAITNVSNKIAGQVSFAVLKELQAHDAALQATTTLLCNVEQRARGDGRNLSFEKPAYVAAALTESVATLKQIQTNLRAQDIQSAAANADALLSLINKAYSTIKTT